MKKQEKHAPNPDGTEQSLSDYSLLQQVRLGCQEAAARLYHRYARRLRMLTRTRCSPMLSRRIDPDDIVQSVFRRFYGRVYRGGCTVAEGEELWKLFLVITLNRIRAAELYHRAHKRDQRITFGGAGLERSLAASDADDRVFLDLATAEVLERLPDRHRRVAQLRMEGHTVAEVAELLDRSPRTVERLLQECRAKLEAFFDDSI